MMSSSWCLSWCLKLSCDVLWCLVVSDAHLMMFHVSSWSWLTSYDTFFWCRSCCLMVSNVLWCLVMSHNVSWCLILCHDVHDVSCYFMMSQGVSWCLSDIQLLLTMPLNVLCCLMLPRCRDVSWCMSQCVSCCLMSCHVLSCLMISDDITW